MFRFSRCSCFRDASVRLILGITDSTGDACVPILGYMRLLHHSRIRVKVPCDDVVRGREAVDELGAVGRTKLSCRSFKACTVPLIEILTLGARYTPEMYTLGVNPLSELLNAHVTSWWLAFLIIISVLTFTDPMRTSSQPDYQFLRGHIPCIFSTLPPPHSQVYM